MSLYLNGTVDPIAAAGGRELTFVPKHFHCISLSDMQNAYFDNRIIRKWIWQNQSGRFAISTRVKMRANSFINEPIVAFEDASEAIMFSFILPTLSNDLSELFI